MPADPADPRGSARASGPSPALSRVRRQAFLLEYATIVWNALEGAVTIIAGIIAGSVALVAFGLDSAVEVFASAVVVWELKGADRRHEGVALRLIGTGYLAVAAYVTWQAVAAVIDARHPEASPIGIAFLAATVLAMVALGLGKRRVGRRLDSATVLADARFSFVDAALAASVLVGLVLTALLGLWWADAVLALAISALAVREGVEAWRHDAGEGGRRRRSSCDGDQHHE